MKSFEAHAQIDATPQRVWTVLIDTEHWPSWDSGVDGVDGTVDQGAKITIRSQAAPGRTFPVRVTTLDEPHTLVFTGGMPLGLFTGVRTYSLSTNAGGTAFRMREEYTGPLLGLLGRSMPDLAPSFTQFAHGLKSRAESDG